MSIIKVFVFVPFNSNDIVTTNKEMGKTKT